MSTTAAAPVRQRGVDAAATAALVRQRLGGERSAIQAGAGGTSLMAGGASS